MGIIVAGVGCWGPGSGCPRLRRQQPDRARIEGYVPEWPQASAAVQAPRSRSAVRRLHAEVTFALMGSRLTGCQFIRSSAASSSSRKPAALRAARFRGPLGCGAP